MNACGAPGQGEAFPERSRSPTNIPTVSSSQPRRQRSYNAMRMPRLSVQRTTTSVEAATTKSGSGQVNRPVTRSQTKALSEREGQMQT